MTSNPVLTSQTCSSQARETEQANILLCHIVVYVLMDVVSLQREGKLGYSEKLALKYTVNSHLHSRCMVIQASRDPNLLVPSAHKHIHIPGFPSPDPPNDDHQWNAAKRLPRRHQSLFSAARGKEHQDLVQPEQSCWESLSGWVVRRWTTEHPQPDWWRHRNLQHQMRRKWMSYTINMHCC